MRPISRVEPRLSSQEMRSYQIVAPPSTHFRPSTCEEIGCYAREFGWTTKLDESTDLGKQQAYYIRNSSGRRYTEDRIGPMTTFTFEPGQKCFRQHQTRLDRPAIYSVRDGDWRGSTNRRVHASAEDWVDDFKNHQDRIITAQERG